MKPDLAPYAAGSHRPPSPRQIEALVFIATYMAERGYPPTVREISDSMGIASTNGAAEHVDRLERKGLLRRAPLVSRGLVITESGRAFIAALPGPAPVAAPEGGS
jgi:repressor LexA